MKKIFTFCAVVALLAACAKEAPKAPVADGFSAPAENNEPTKVQFKSNVVASVETKAQGSFNAWDATQTLHVYGFERKKEMDYTATPFIDNVSAISPAGDAPKNTLSVTQENEDGDIIPYYYAGNSTYDFYGYYIDDLDVEPDPRTDGIYLSLELTGGEDIMVAKADPKTDSKNAKDEGHLTGEWDYRYAYSAYAARRGVHPTLNFQHQLVQFNFKIESGYSKYRTDGVENPELIINGLTIKAVNEADLCVVGSNLGFTNIGTTKVDLSLCSLVDGELKTLVPYSVPDKDAIVAEEDKVIGHSLMVIPNPEGTSDDYYEVTLDMTYDGVPAPYTGKIKFSDINLEGLTEEQLEKVADQTQFTAGFAYEVSIKVYGLEEIVITANMDEWKAGGKIVIDTDEAPEVWGDYDEDWDKDEETPEPEPEPTPNPDDQENQDENGTENGDENGGEDNQESVN